MRNRLNWIRGLIEPDLGSYGHDTFLSPFTWRYGSEEMRRIFSERERRRAWRRIWASLARAQAAHDLISQEELKAIESKVEEVDLAKAQELEKEIKHELMAELRAFASGLNKGGGKLHLGATSADIEDNADVLIIGKGLNLLLTRLINLIDTLANLVERYSRLPCMGWTHLQPAEPTTLGYRLANYCQDLLLDVALVEFFLQYLLKGKGVKGAVGTGASYHALLGEEARRMEDQVMAELGLSSFLVATQTYPRKLDYLLLVLLASIAQSAHRFAFDLRILQCPNLGETSEPLKEEQVGSSAMPAKRNPVKAERICSLARYVAALPQVALQNAFHGILERTLDDSANRRIILPEAFLAVEECLLLYNEIARGMKVYEEGIKRNLERYAPFSALEPIMMELVKRGADRQEVHERLRKISLKAWEEVMKGGPNPLKRLLEEDGLVGTLLPKEELEGLLKVEEHLGDAPKRCKEFLEREVRPLLRRHSERLERQPSPTY